MSETQPRTPGQRRARLAVRVTPEQKALLQRAAALRGLSLAGFLVQSAQAAAEEVIRKREIITLSARDTAVLVEALLNPPPPNEALRAALRRHRDLVDSRPSATPLPDGIAGL